MQNRQTSNETRGKNWSEKWVAPGLVSILRGGWLGGVGHRTTGETTENALISEACSPEAPAKYMRKKKGGSMFLPLTKGMRDIQRHFERGIGKKKLSKVPIVWADTLHLSSPISRNLWPRGLLRIRLAQLALEKYYTRISSTQGYIKNISIILFKLFVSSRSVSLCLNCNQLWSFYGRLGLKDYLEFNF